MTTARPSSRSTTHQIADQVSSIRTRVQKTACAIGRSSVNHAVATVQASSSLDGAHDCPRDVLGTGQRGFGFGIQIFVDRSETLVRSSCLRGRTRDD